MIRHTKLIFVAEILIILIIRNINTYITLLQTLDVQKGHGLINSLILHMYSNLWQMLSIKGSVLIIKLYVYTLKFQLLNFNVTGITMSSLVVRIRFGIKKLPEFDPRIYDKNN